MNIGLGLLTHSVGTVRSDTLICSRGKYSVYACFTVLSSRGPRAGVAASVQTPDRLPMIVPLR